MSVQEGNKALRAGLAYTIGNIFIKGINFLALPVFSRLMTTEEFGIYSVFLSYDAILFVIIGLALHSSVRSASYKFQGKIDEYVSSISMIYLINMIILLFTSIIFGKILADLFGFARVIVYLLILYSFGEAILNLYNDRISLDYAYKKYIMVALFNSVGNIGLSFVLMFTIFKKSKEIGRIFGTTITIFLISIGLLSFLYKKARPKFNKEYILFGIKYSLPIIPHGISQILLSQFDRIMIRNMIGASEAGIYSLAGNIKVLITTVTTSISSAWSTWFYAEITKENNKNIQKKAVQLSLLFFVFTVGLIAISPELIYFFGGGKYIAGKYVAIPVILDAFVLALYNIIVPSEYYAEKTVYIMMGTIFAATINIFTNYIFIKQYGYIAAAYTTLFSYICYLILHIIISYKLIDFFVIPIKWIFIFLIGLVCVSAWNLYFIKNIVIRWVTCVIVLVPIIINLIKYYYKDNYKLDERGDSR